MLVGRARELAEIGDCLRAAGDGEARVVLVSGEPGIGKTRLAEEVRRLAVRSGLATCWGRATDEEGSPPYWPFRQVIRTLATDHPDQMAFLGSTADDLARLAPELGSRTREAEAPGSAIRTARGLGPPANPEERFRLFETASAFLGSVAADSGLLVVLDDLQWADPSSLLLLVHVARGAARTGLVVIGTYRDTEIGAPLRNALAALGRERTVRRMPLGGLSRPEVAMHLAAVTGQSVPDALVAEVSDRTHGNPFFINELAHLVGDGDSAEAKHIARGLPDAVRDAVRERLSRLSPRCQSLLQTAAVVGAEPDVEILKAVAEVTSGDVLASLDEAADAGIIVAEGAGRYRFTHDLVREAARLDVATATRLGIHAKAAQHLQGRADVGGRLAEIAHHWLESLPAGDRRSAVDSACRAALQAMAQLAWEEAVRLYDLALGAINEAPFGDAERVAVLLGRATALCQAGDVVGARASSLEAAAAARAVGDNVSIGRAALINEGFARVGSGPAIGALCEEALAGLPEEDSPLRARLLGQLAVERSVANETDSVGPLSTEALDMAERVGDPGSLRTALRARQMACSGHDGTEERLALGQRLVDLGRTERDNEAMLWGRLWRFDALMQLGEVGSADAELDQIEELAEWLRLPLARWHLLRGRAAVAFGRGQFAECVDSSLRSAEVQVPAFDAVMLLVSILTGRNDLPVERALVPTNPVPAMVGWWHLELGRREEARAIYEKLPRLERAPAFLQLMNLGVHARLAAAFDDREKAVSLYDRLAPFAHRHLCSGAGVIVTTGSAHLALGQTAALTGRLDLAIRHLRAAVSANDCAGLVPFVALSRYELAATLASRARHGDIDESVALAADAATVANRLGMAPLLNRARCLAVDGATKHAATALLSPRQRDIAALVARGLTNRQIAAAVHISERTAENHVQHILTKLGFQNRSQIAAWAVAEGIADATSAAE